MNEKQKMINILRRATALVQIAPFIFAFVHLLCMIVYMFVNDCASTICDMLFYVSPLLVGYNLILSKLFHLCKWHKLECVLPLFPLIAVFVDELIYSLSAISLWLNWGLVSTMIILSLINAYFVFIKN